MNFNFVLQRYTMAEDKKPGFHWNRPEHLMGARIWHRENGIVVRDVTPDFYPFVVEHMTKYYITSEPMFSSKRVHESPAAVKDMQSVWQNIFLPQRISLVALQEGTAGANLEEVSANNPPELVGVNLLITHSKSDTSLPDLNSIPEESRDAISTFLRCSALVDSFERYGVDVYVDGVGMSVPTKWRGKGIGQMLVKARKEMCKALSISLTCTVFSAIQSQKVALKEGFELLGELFYADLKTPDGQLMFPNMNPDQKKVQLMALRIL